MNRHIDTLLIANRGEIACRIMKNCQGSRPKNRGSAQ